MVTTAHQKASGIDLKKDASAPASAKYTADENRTTPVIYLVGWMMICFREMFVLCWVVLGGVASGGGGVIYENCKINLDIPE